MNTSQLNKIIAQLSNVKFTEMAKSYAAYSSNQDVRQEARDFDKQVAAYAKQSPTEKWADDVQDFADSFRNRQDVLMYATKWGELMELTKQAVQFQQDVAKKLDDEFGNILIMELSKQKLTLGRKFVEEFKKHASRVLRKCKVANAGTIHSLTDELNQDELILQYEEKIAKLQSSKAHTLSWCDKADELRREFYQFGLNYPEAEDKCRNRDVLMVELADYAIRTRMEIECEDYVTALTGTINFEKVFELDKEVKSHLNALHVIVPDFDKKWTACVRAAKNFAAKQAEAWYKEVIAKPTTTAAERTKNFKLLLKAVEYGNLDAIFVLGDYYLFGRGTDVNEAKAFELYQKAADNGDVRAYYPLGFCYHRGKGCTANVKKAFEYYKMGAETTANYSKKGDCIRNYAACYEMGNGVAKNATAAFKYYEMAANLGLAAAMYDVGRCYEKGIGVAMSEDKALAWYEKGEKGGDALCQKAVKRIKDARKAEKERKEKERIAEEKRQAEIRRQKQLEEERRRKEAEAAERRRQEQLEAERRRKEAEAAERRRQEEIARKERERREAERRRQEEEALRQKRLQERINVCVAQAQRGDVNAMFELAEYYFTGNGVTQSLRDAFIWYEKAAKKGHKKAMEKLGDCYYNGYGTAKNFSLAEKWYSKSMK